MTTDSDRAEDDLGTGPEVPPSEPATVHPPVLACVPDILNLVTTELVASGVAGEDRVGRVLYLVVTSRLLARPCSVAVKGPSAGGKSFIVEQVLRLFPDTAYYALTAMSERALAYDTEPLVHRMLVLYEAAGISGETASYLMRSLLSEGRISYVTVVKVKSELQNRCITREGPTGLITTTTRVSLHPENETRLLSMTVTDSSAQTRAIMLATAIKPVEGRDRSPWHELQTWLAAGPVEVVVPYARALAEAIPPIAVRLRRDFATLLTLVQAHALLHQCSRGRDADGAVVATLDDYAMVRELVADLIADGAERALPPTIRETVAVVAALTADDILDEGMPVTRIAAELGIDKSSALRRVRVAEARGFLRNLEDRRGRPGRLVLGDPLPDDGELLPTAEELARLHGCMSSGTDDIELEQDYPRSAWETDQQDSDVLAVAGFEPSLVGAEP
jgi:hypothetical protein